MYVLGHAGLTAAAALAVNRSVDLRLACALALLPDVWDKSVKLLAPTLHAHNTRGFGHTLVAALLVFAALSVWRRDRRDWWQYGLCYAAHMLLDLGWISNHPRVWFWPLLGPLPRPARESYTAGVQFYNAAGELLGGAVLLWIAVSRRLHAPGRLSSFLRDGRV